MIKEQTLDSNRSWRRLAVTLLIAIIGNVGIWAIVVVMPAMQVDFGMDRAGASLPYVATMIGFGIGNLAIGHLVDRFGITPSLIFSALIVTSGYGLASVSGNVPLLVVSQFFVGFGTSVGFGPLIADISLWFQRYRGIAVAIAASGNYLSGAVWTYGIGNILAEQGWRGAYMAIAVITLVLIVPLAFLLRARPSVDAIETSDAIARAHGISTGFSPSQLQWLLALAGIGCCVAMSMPQVHIVALSIDLGFGTAAGAQMLSLMLIGGVVSRLLSGLLADRIGGIKTLLVGSVLQCLALFLFIPVDSLVPLYAVSLIFGLAQGGIVPSYALIVREYLPAKEAGARIGFVIMATIIGMALGGWLSGLIYDVTGSYTMAFINGIIWNFLNIAIMLMILFRARRQFQQNAAPQAAPAI